MKKYRVYKIIADGIIVGAISVHEQSENHHFLGALFVIPEYSNQGIGQETMKFLDGEFVTAVHRTLEIPADKEQNQYFYKKMGYQVTKEYLDGIVSISYFERHII